MAKKSQEKKAKDSVQDEQVVKRPVGLVHMMPKPVGRPLKFSKAEAIWDKFVEYCDFVDGSPWELKSGRNSIDSRSGGNVNSMSQEVRVIQRAYTLYGFCAFAGIRDKWANFKRNYTAKGNDFAAVLETIENVVCAQQVDGAIINQFNSGLVARLNGIADKQITEVTGKDGEEFRFPKLTALDIEELRKQNGL